MKKQIIFLSILMLLGISQIPLVLGDIYPSIEVTFREDPVIASSGNQGYIALNINSVGSGTIEDIRIVATSSDFITIKPDSDWDKNLGDLHSGNSVTSLFKFQVSSSATAGLYEVKFKVYTTNAGSFTRYAIIKVEEVGIVDIVKVEPDVLNIGEVNEMTITIANNGQDTFNDVLMYWEDTDNYILPSGSDNRLIISTIEPENTTEISFNVIVNPALIPGVYPIFVTMEYYDRTGTKQSILSEVGLQIGGSTNFEIILQDSTGGATTFAIANTGANIASSVIVSIPIKPNFSVNGVTSRSLGNLDAGDYTLASFQISLVELNDSQKPDKYSWEKPSNFSKSKEFWDSKTGIDGLTVEILYTDLFGVRHTIEKEVDFSSSSDKSDFNSKSDFSGKYDSYDTSSGLDNGTLYIIIGVVGIIAIIALLQIGKRKKK